MKNVNHDTSVTLHLHAQDSGPIDRVAAAKGTGPPT